MDALAKLHWDAICAQQRDPNSEETRLAIRRFNQRVADELEAILPENPKQPEENRAIIGQENPDNEATSARVDVCVCPGPVSLPAPADSTCSEATGAAVLPAASVPAGSHLPDAGTVREVGTTPRAV